MSASRQTPAAAAAAAATSVVHPRSRSVSGASYPAFLKTSHFLGRERTDPNIQVRQDGLLCAAKMLHMAPRYFLIQPKPNSIGLNCHADLCQFQTPALSHWTKGIPLASSRQEKNLCPPGTDERHGLWGLLRQQAGPGPCGRGSRTTPRPGACRLQTVETPHTRTRAHLPTDPTTCPSHYTSQRPFARSHTTACGLPGRKCPPQPLSADTSPSAARAALAGARTNVSWLTMKRLVGLAGRLRAGWPAHGVKMSRNGI
jgi:hypothetical protein